MKSYRELQVALNRAVEGVQSERPRSERIYNDLIRYLTAQVGIPKGCAFFVTINEGQAALISPNASGIVFTNEDRSWSVNLVLRIHQTGPRANHIHLLIVPRLTFQQDEVAIGISDSSVESVTLNHTEGEGTNKIVEKLSDLVTEAAALRMDSFAGGDDRKIGFAQE